MNESIDKMTRKERFRDLRTLRCMLIYQQKQFVDSYKGTLFNRENCFLSKNNQGRRTISTTIKNYQHDELRTVKYRF